MPKFDLLYQITDFIKTKPFWAGTIALLGFGLLLLRKLHYKFIVYPNIQGRSNKDNSHQYQHPSNRGMDSQDIEIKTPDSIALRGWYIKKENAKYMTIYYHQNAGNIGTRLYYIQSLMKHIDTNVLIVAYRGFSDSDGTAIPNEKNIADDAKSIFYKAMELAKRDKLPLFVFGRSLGGYSAISTLSQAKFHHQAKGLILENTFTSIFDVAIKFSPKFLRPLVWPLLWIVTSGSYNSIKKIGNVDTPILFVKGSNDQLIPKVHMDTLQQKYSSLKKQNFEYVVEGGGHNDTWYVGGRNYFAALNDFFSHSARL